MSRRGIGEPFVQGQRQPNDGDPIVGWLDEEHLSIEHKGEHIVLSDYNAARVFAMLSLMLGIRLPTPIGRKIMLFGQGPAPSSSGSRKRARKE